MKPPTRARRGVRPSDARRMVLALAGVSEGRSYGLPSFLLAGRFFARFRDDETVLVLQLGAITDRDVLMQMDPGAFFFTEHYRNYPAVLVRLAEVPRPLLKEVLAEARSDLVARRGTRTAETTGKRRPRRKRADP